MNQFTPYLVVPASVEVAIHLFEFRTVCTLNSLDRNILVCVFWYKKYYQDLTYPVNTGQAFRRMYVLPLSICMEPNIHIYAQLLWWKPV